MIEPPTASLELPWKTGEEVQARNAELASVAASFA